RPQTAPDRWLVQHWRACPPEGTIMTITKRIESIDNLQDLFNFTVKRVLANRRPAYNQKWNSCAYRTERIGGYRSCCVAGAVIPPELYTPEAEGQDILGLQNNGLYDKVFPANIRNIPQVYDFLRYLQRAHDTHAYRWEKGFATRKQFQQDFLNAATRVTQDYGLDHTQVR